MIFQTFYPDSIEESAYAVDFSRLYRQGIRGIIFDIDNTLVEHGADADDRARQLFKDLRELGMESCLLSNNKEERVMRFNKDIGTHYIYKAGKPSRRGYEQAMELMGTDLAHTVFVGDQLFTDVWGAKRMGMANILVRPIGKKEEIQIVLKRCLEKIVLFFYEREQAENHGI